MAQIVWFAVLKSDQSSGKSGHKRPNFTRLSLCYSGLNFNETSLRGLRGVKLEVISPAVAAKNT